MTTPLTPQGLSPSVFYLAPSGRLCHWVPGQRPDPHCGSAYQFQYIAGGVDGVGGVAPDGFAFTAQNLRLLVAVAAGRRGALNGR